MSKVVKKAGRAIGNLVGGVKKAVSNVWKKIKDNKILKTLAIGAAVFFTGGAALGALGGAMSGAAAGSGVLGSITGAISGGLSGAMAGISSAWGSVVSAGSSLASGQFAQAGSTLLNAPAAAFKAGGQSVAGAMGQMATNAVSGNTSGAAVSGGTGGAPVVESAPSFVPGSSSPAMVGPPTQAGAMGPPTASSVGVQTPQMSPMYQKAAQEAVTTLPEKPSIFKQMLENPFMVPAAMQVGGRALSGYAAAKGQEQAEKDYLERKNRNMGTPLFPGRYQSQN